MTYGQLHLIAIEGNTANLGFVFAAQGGIDGDLRVRHFKGLTHGLQSLASRAGCNHAAHLHFAGGDQAQVDPLLAEAIEQACCNAGAPHDPGATNAQFGEAALC